MSSSNPPGRRGGLNMRGGRLPVSLGRDGAAAKKPVAPKIPTRRVRVKEENSELPDIPRACAERGKARSSEHSRGRGRTPKVYLQTEGSFLGEGPAAMRVKKEGAESYERFSSSSYPKGKSDCDAKIDPNQINELLDHYDAEEAYSNQENLINPVRLPFPKLVDVKKEECINIKKEIVGDADPIGGSCGATATKIKQEPSDGSKWNALEGKFFSKIEGKEPKRRSILEDFYASFEKDILVLIQLPSCLPFDRDSEESKHLKASSEDHDSKEVVEANPAGLNRVPEGLLGKLQFMKSGKVRLNIGGVSFELEQAVHPETVSEVASVAQGEMAILGSIEKRLILRPVLDSVLQEP